MFQGKFDLITIIFLIFCTFPWITNSGLFCSAKPNFSLLQIVLSVTLYTKFDLNGLEYHWQMKFLNPVTLSLFHFGVTILHFYPLFNYSSHLALLVSIANRASQQQPPV